MTNPTYDRRRKMGVCVNCGDPNVWEGRKTCKTCTLINRVKSKQRQQHQSEEVKQRKYACTRKWFAEHPEKVKEYREKAKENRELYWGKRRKKDGLVDYVS